MRTRYLHLLCCPDCEADLALRSAEEQVDDDVVEGELECEGCRRGYPIRKRVPIFVPPTDYVEMFGWQWSKYNKLQRDSYNGSHMVRRTIMERTGWSSDHLADKLVLECGCGSGNDTEILAGMTETVVSLDLSEGVHHFAPDLLQRENVLAIQADLTNAPVKKNFFDVVYCHRVIHHTPDPETSFKAIARHLRPGGELFLECYSRHWKSMMNFKYIWRPITTRLPRQLVYWVLSIAGPPLYVLHGILNRMAFLRRLNHLVIPFEYQTRMLKKVGSKLTPREHYDYSFLVTFDALTPTYDNPQHPETIRGWCEAQGMEQIEQPFINPVITRCRRPLDDATLDPVADPERVQTLMEGAPTRPPDSAGERPRGARPVG